MTTEPGTVAFIHVPKAGGTSYGRLLAEMAPGENWIAPVGRGMTSEEAHEAFSPELAARCTLVGGHLDFDICRTVPTMRPVTVLRDPIDRLVSTYHYFALGDLPVTAPWRDHFVRNDVSLRDFLQEREMWRAVVSGAVPQLVGVLWSGRPAPSSDDELLHLAVDNLRSCTHVGIHERFEDSARLLGIELGVDDVPSLPHLNRSGGEASELPPDLRARLEEELALEYELYRAAAALFDERFAASGLIPAAVTEPVRTSLAARPVDQTGVGSWIELEGRPEPGAAIGGSFDGDLPVAELHLDSVVDQSGVLVAERHPEGRTGVNWVRVPHGVYLAEITVWCAPDDPGAPDAWVAGFNLIWCRDDPFWRTPLPPVPGFPERPDVVESRAVPVPTELPFPVGTSVPVTASMTIRAPGVGHLCLLMGTSRPVHTTAADRLRLLYVKLA